MIETVAEREPAYRRIADELRAAIESGELAEGARLPSTRELMARYGVAMTTATHVFEVLRGEGLVVSRRASGHYVRRPGRILRSSPERLAREGWASGTAIQDHEIEPRRRSAEVAEPQIVPAPEFVAAALDVDQGAPVFMRFRLYRVDGQPVQLATSYFPAELVRDTRIEDIDTGPGGVFARLREAGYGPSRFIERVLARVPDHEEARALALPGDRARVFEITRYAYASEQCVEVNRMILDAAAYELAYTFDA